MSRRLFPSNVGLAALFAAAAPFVAHPSTEEHDSPPIGGVVSQDGPPVELSRPDVRAGIDGGEPRIEDRDDVRRPVPLPVRARWIEGELGDSLEAEASGDPHFVGFVGGELRPAAGERVDGRLIERLVHGIGADRPLPETYAYVMLDAAASPALEAELAGAGARVLGFRPHNAFAVAVGHEALAQIEALDFVRWIGVARAEHKMHPRLLDAFQGVDAGHRGALVVSVFETDLHAGSRAEALAPTELSGPGVRETHEMAGARWRSEGWQQRAIEAIGADVIEYLPSIHAFRIRATAAEVAQIVERDFVEFVEAEYPLVAMHDDSQPMIGTDYTRATYDGSWSGAAIGGEIDSGIDVNHTGLDHVWFLGWSLTGSGSSIDACKHGTHVAGSILARPHSALAELAGAAPGLGTQKARAFRNVKFMEPNPDPGGNSCVGGASLESLFSLMRDSWSDGQTTFPKPHFVNNSWGTNGTPGGWTGTEANARSVDAEVWNNHQVYIFSAGNGGPGARTLTQESSAKNALAVGNVLPFDDSNVGPPSTLWTSSSRGPTADSRWKPNVVAPGRNILSTDAHSGNGYAYSTGTSMAAPHVAGVVAQLVDRHPILRYAPARTASLLMATAHTKGGVVLTNPDDSHLSQYGAGRVDAWRAMQSDGQHTWANWGLTLGPTQNASGDFTIGAGAQRLVVVMHYIERASSAGASKALINDFDLVLDAEPFAAGNQDGDYFAQQSNRNNTEIRVLDNPKVGAWRWKIHPVAATSNVRVAVTVHVVYAAPKPNPTLTLQASKAFIKPNETITVSATVSNPSHVASAVHLDTVATTAATILSATTALKDGLIADLTDNFAGDGGRDATLGNIVFGTDRRVDWTVRWPIAGTKTWTVNGTSDNGMNRSAQVQVVVDGTPPGIVGNLHSTSHTPGVWSSANILHFSWTHAPDNLAGVGAYGHSVTDSPTLPGPGMTLPFTNSTTLGPAASSAAGRYLNIRAIDKSGNWSSDYASVGPFLIDTVAPGAASGLVSNTHQPHVWSNNAVVNMQWTAAPDAHSGIDGYNAAWTVLPMSPGHVKILGAVTSTQSQPFGSSLSGRWFALRAVDKAGNWSGSTVNAGPFLIDVTAPTIHSVGISNGGLPSKSTTSLSVEVTISAADVHSGLGQMRLRNDGGNWSPWIAFSPSIEWHLAALGGMAITGTRRVQVEVRDIAGNTTGSEAEVYYYKPHSFFGPPGVGAAGVPGIQVIGVFGVGKSATVSVTNTTAPWRRLVIGVPDTQWNGWPLPLDLGLFGALGNTLLVSPDVVLYEGAGDTVPFSVPPGFGNVGKKYRLQWLLFGDPSGASVVTTRAVDFELNGP